MERPQKDWPTIKVNTRHKRSCHSLSVLNWCYAKILILVLEKVFLWVQILTKILYNLHSYINRDNKKRWYIRLAPVFYACKYLFATLTDVCNAILSDYFKKSGFERFFWSAQCTERQLRTFDIVKTWDFSSPKEQWWKLKDNVEYCNILLPSEAAFLEV